jgi:hypothetical protein
MPHVSVREYAAQSVTDNSRRRPKSGLLKARSETLRTAANSTKEARHRCRPFRGRSNGCAAFARRSSPRVYYCPNVWPGIGAACRGMAPAGIVAPGPLQPHGGAAAVVLQPQGGTAVVPQQASLRWKSPPSHPAPRSAAEKTRAAVQCLMFTIALSILFIKTLCAGCSSTR